MSYTDADVKALAFTIARAVRCANTMRPEDADTCGIGLGCGMVGVCNVPANEGDFNLARRLLAQGWAKRADVLEETADWCGKMAESTNAEAAYQIAERHFRALARQ